MIDISSLNPLFIQIPLLLILVFGLISGLKDGIVKKIIDLIFLVVLFVLMVFFVPPLAKQLEATGWIQSFVNNHITGDLATVISSILTGPVYVVITSVGVILIYGIIKFFVNFVFTRIFKKNILTRFLGGVWQLAINFVFCAVIMVVIASPSIFNGGDKLLSETEGVKQVYGGVVKIQEVLKDKNMPYSLESFFGKALAGKDATAEDVARYQSTLERIPHIIDSVNDGSIVSQVIDSEGNINQENANLLLNDVVVFTELVNKLPESQRDVVSKPLVDVITAGRDQLIQTDGTPIGTIEVTEELKNTLNEACTNLGLDEAILSDLNKCLVIK